MVPLLRVPDTPAAGTRATLVRPEAPLLSATLALALLAAPRAVRAAEPWTRTGWGGGVLPATNYNTDDGFGYGVLANLYRYDGETAPYRTSLLFQVFATTRQVHSHKAVFDAPRLLGTPLRLQGEVQYLAYRSYPYCGLGYEADCDADAALALAEAEGLSGEDAEAFARQVYQVPYALPNAWLDARWPVREGPLRVELMGGWRGSLLVPGGLAADGPYDGSLYAREFPDGESGFLSVLQLGVMADSRDNEPAPTSGLWAEASVRGAAPAWGSAWTYVGDNLTLRAYLPLAGPRLVLAERIVQDGIFGDASVIELGTVGGSWPYTAFGGAEAGRGIRLARYPGRFRLFAQSELRWRAAELTLLGRLPLSFTLAGFVDVGAIAERWCEADEALARPRSGEGLGLRVALDENFVVRADVAVSAVEGWSPGIYLDVGNLY